MLEVHLECFTECLHVSAEGLVKSLLGEVGGVGGGEDGEDALLQALLRSLRTVGGDALVSSWGQLGGKIIFPEVSHQLMKKDFFLTSSLKACFGDIGLSCFTPPPLEEKA